MKVKKRKKKYKSVITARILRSAKRAGLVLFALFLVVNMGKMSPTNSAYTDEEHSSGNEFEAATLDLGLNSSVLAEEYDFKAGDEAEGSVEAENAGSADFQYKLEFQKISGDDALCHGLELEAEKNGTPAYDGALDDFDFNAGNLNSGNSDGWDFDVSLPVGASSSLEGLECKFSFAFTAWQTGLPDTSSGFFDAETYGENLISAGDWTAPEISAVDNSDPQNTKSATNDNMAIVDIAWTTNEDATSNVVYGTLSKPDCSSYPFSAPTPSDTSANNTSHSVRLANLTPGSTYYYRVLSSDAANNSSCSSEKHFTVPYSSDSPVSADIVLNEFVPNPADDSADKPDGEWVELYNKSGSDVDVSGWYVYDSTNASGVPITALNTEPAGTIVPSDGYLVVYIEKSYFNNDGDTVKLYSGVFGTGVLIDSHSYAGTVPEEKSFARFPDGVGVWIDPENTPGEKNELNADEMEQFRSLASEKCFDADGKVKKSKEDVCQAEFLVYLGMLDNKKDSGLADSMRDMFLEIIPSPDSQDSDSEDTGSSDAGAENNNSGNENVSGNENSENSGSSDADGGVNTSSTDQSPAADDKKEPEEEDEPEIISKTFDIKVSGKLDAPEGFEADASQKMKKIELSGEEKAINDLKDFEIDLSKIKIAGKDDKIKILVSDLDIPKDVKTVDAKKEDVAVLITVTEKPKEDPKKDEVEKADATVPKADSPKKDDKKDDSKGEGGGDGGDGPDPQ